MYARILKPEAKPALMRKGQLLLTHAQLPRRCPRGSLLLHIIKFPTMVCAQSVFSISSLHYSILPSSVSRRPHADTSRGRCSPRQISIVIPPSDLRPRPISTVVQATGRRTPPGATSLKVVSSVGLLRYSPSKCLEESQRTTCTKHGGPWNPPVGIGAEGCAPKG